MTTRKPSSTPESASSPTGRLVVGRYRLGRVVDKAALCNTFEAVDIETREQISVELITRPKGAGPPVAKQLRNEARRIVDAKHPGLRVARTIGVEDGVPFVVADPVLGESLRERLKRGGPLPVAESVAIALQVIEAMGVAHAAGLVHGNLKPEKIRLVARPNDAPVATVMGLGLSALLGTMRNVDTRRLGTPPYLAPEQLGVAPVTDELTDVWGIGLLVFEMLTGRRAFDGASADEVARLILAPGIVRVRQHRADVPVPLELIVSATLTRSREQRLSLRDLRRALRDAMPSKAALQGPKTAPVVIVASVPNLGDPCDDAEAPTDLDVHVETDLDSF